MYRYLLNTIFLVFCYSSSFSQNVFQEEKRDAIWLLGYDNNPINTDFGGTLIDFNQQPATFDYQFRYLNFDMSNASICDKEGRLLFYSNGVEIANYLHDLMDNGDSLVSSVFSQNWLEEGYPMPQGVLIIPLPQNDSIFYLIHEEKEWTNGNDPDGIVSKVFGLNRTIIDLNANNGLGKVIEKNIPILQDTIDFGKITSVRHANGRDWWILIGELDSAKFYRFLLSPQGLVEVEPLEIGEISLLGLGQAAFSPDGQWYARINSRSIPDGQFLDIFRFDRCAGEFYDPVQITYNDTAYATGVAISPNSRYLYVPSFKYVYQFDLWAQDIGASKELIAVWDGFSSPAPLGSTTFFLAQLAPNGKIYISANNTTNYLHVIHNPNAAFPECQLEQHGQQLPTLNKFSMPNYPYWRLGPLDGSPCDTLGIDNHPRADFRYLSEDFSVDFYDYSLFDPQHWSWIFGDGEISSEQNPQHTYLESGVYEVCLTVSNDNASDTHCQEVSILIDDIDTPQPGNVLRVFPNPAQELLYLKMEDSGSGSYQWRLFDALGNVVKDVPLNAGETQTLALTGLASGLYYWTLTDHRQLLQSGKLVVE